MFSAGKYRPLTCRTAETLCLCRLFYESGIMLSTCTFVCACVRTTPIGDILRPACRRLPVRPIFSFFHDCRACFSFRLFFSLFQDYRIAQRRIGSFHAKTSSIRPAVSIELQLVTDRHTDQGPYLPPLRSRPPLRLGRDLGARISSLAGPAAKLILMHFRHKYAPF